MMAARPFCSAALVQGLLVAVPACAGDTGFGGIAGTITAAPLAAGVAATVYYQRADQFGSPTELATGPDGTYDTGLVLEPGTYYLAAGITNRAALWDSKSCPSNGAPICLLHAGTPIVVTAETTANGIDLELPQTGTITVLVQCAGQAAVGAVSVFDDGGVAITGGSYGSGPWVSPWIATGVYHLRANGQSQNGRPCINQLLGTDACPFEASCDPTIGDDVVVETDQTTQAAFSLQEGFGIAGGVTNGGTGLGHVEILDASGLLAETVPRFGPPDALTYQSGFVGLPAGSYFVRTRSGAGVVDELYDDLACEPECDATAGTPVVVGGSPFTTGVDFVLTVADAIFLDDFRSGDACYWSTAVGGPACD